MSEVRRFQRYAGKIALVSGGASGIGRATVAGLVAEGGKVVFTDIAEEAGRLFEDELRGAGHDAFFRPSDATNEASVEADVAFAVERFGRLDVGINNIGNLGRGDRPDMAVHDCDLAAWKATVDVCLTSCFLGMKYQILQMLKQGGGAIANTAALAGIRVATGASPGYAAAKAGVVHLSEHAAVHYARNNIRVNVVAPGLTATPAVLRRFSEATRNEMAGRTQPMGRMMTPEELADAFLWICSDQASGVTGLTIPVDGGWAAN